jgi:hypothetical protein
MARERWFYAQDFQRRGPVSLAELVDGVISQKDPRAVLVWRKGHPGWTRAEDVPEVEERLAPVLARREAEEAERQRRPPTPPPAAPGGGPLLLYGGIAAGVLVTALAAWLLWPRPETAPRVVPLGGTTAENAPAVAIPAPASTPEPSATPPAPAPPAATPAPSTEPASTAEVPTPASAAVAEEERDLPRSEMRKLRQVAAWSGNRLELTVVNNTEWRITELDVQIQRFVGDEVLDDQTPLVLLPPGAEVDDEVASLLNKVAPDRRKPGVNPLDTGVFAGEAGIRPDGFRCEIVAARGYPPR